MLSQYKNKRPKEVAQLLYKQKVVRYFFAAGTATVVDVVVYKLMLDLVLHRQPVELSEQLVLAAITVSICVSYSCGLITNFLITKYFVFHESEMRGRSQFGRFVLVAGVVFFANYLATKGLTEYLHWYPTVARAASAVTIGLFSFAAHKAFSFKMS
jgi:putative flippase GtrA